MVNLSVGCHPDTISSVRSDGTRTPLPRVSSLIRLLLFYYTLPWSGFSRSAIGERSMPEWELGTIRSSMFVIFFRGHMRSAVWLRQEQK